MDRIALEMDRMGRFFCVENIEILIYKKKLNHYQVLYKLGCFIDQSVCLFITESGNVLLVKNSCRLSRYCKFILPDDTHSCISR